MAGDSANALSGFKPQKDFFIGIDSDGSVFDTMSIKQRECFIPWTIAYFGLQPVAQAARECKEFSDISSKTRGINRHKATKRVIGELLPGHPLVKARGFQVPRLPHYFAWVDDPESTLSNDGLKQAIAGAADAGAKAELKNALAWSEKVNQVVEQIVRAVPAFPYARESLEKAAALADLIVVSQTPDEALRREWRESGLADNVRLIVGQEMGSKSAHLAAATQGKYQQDRMLMVGDSLDDLQAAHANGVLFYPILAEKETESWQRFLEEALDKFIAGNYAGDYESGLISEFDALLLEKPPWV